VPVGAMGGSGSGVVRRSGRGRVTSGRPWSDRLIAGTVPLPIRGGFHVRLEPWGGGRWPKAMARSVTPDRVPNSVLGSGPAWVLT
jgi:hypothetical protein